MLCSVVFGDFQGSIDISNLNMKQGCGISLGALVERAYHKRLDVPDQTVNATMRPFSFPPTIINHPSSILLPKIPKCHRLKKRNISPRPQSCPFPWGPHLHHSLPFSFSPRFFSWLVALRRASLLLLPHLLQPVDPVLLYTVSPHPTH